MDSYRPSGEVIDPTAYDVEEIPDDTTARAFVTAHHYSGSYPAARWRYGLYHRGELVGVAVFSVPAQPRVLTSTFPGVPTEEAVELGRFVLLDSVPANGESWLIARCFERLRREGVAGVVSYSDPCTRTSSAGVEVFGGHLGVIYQATNGIYLGRATPRTLRLLPDGSVFSDRAASKVRRRERGWRYAVEQLVGHGAREPEDGEDLAAWWAEVREAITRRRRHPGNHKYAWGLHRAVRRKLPTSRPYPKLIA